MIYKDRKEGGELLAYHLEHNLAAADKDNLVVVGLPRGGVEVANYVAKALSCPFDFIVVKKIGHPDNPEFAAGAITQKEIFLNPEFVLPADYLAQRAKILREQIERASAIYRQVKPPVELEGKVVLLIDDGIATGLTMRAAVADIKSQKPSKIFIGAPVGSAQSVRELAEDVDGVFCLYSPLIFAAVGQFYRFFNQLSDDDVIKFLA